MLAILQKKLGIRAKFIIMMAGMGSITLCIIAYGSYKFSIDNAYDDAKTKAKMIYTYVHASNKYFVSAQRPLINELVEKDRFYPELMSGFGITRQTMEIAKKEFKGFEFKQASYNPIWPDNKADSDEAEVINDFKIHPAKTYAEGLIKKNGKTYYYNSQPITVTNKTCLTCHGEAESSPKDLIENYGTNGGHNWKVGENIAAYFVYIPFDDAIIEAKRSAVTLFGIAAATLLLSLLPIWYFLDSRIVKPIMMLSHKAEAISIGKDINKSIYQEKFKDEVGSLAKSIDRLRISIAKMFKR